MLDITDFCPKLRILSILITDFSFQRLAALLIVSNYYFSHREQGLHRPMSMIEPRHLAADYHPYSASSFSHVSEADRRKYRKAAGRVHVRSDLQGSGQPLRHPGHSFSEQALHLQNTPLGKARINSNSLGVLEMAGRTESKGNVQSSVAVNQSAVRKQATSPTRKSELERKINTRQHKGSKGSLHGTLASPESEARPTTPSISPSVTISPASPQTVVNGNTLSATPSSRQESSSPSSTLTHSPTSTLSPSLGEGVMLSARISMTSGGSNRDSSLQQYLFKRQKEICGYMDSIKDRIPIPEECTVQGEFPITLSVFCARTPVDIQCTIYAIYVAYRYFRNFGLGWGIREGLISRFCDVFTKYK